jgi:hypothetical protein
MSDGDWYEVVHGDDLRQGDLLIDCPVFTLSGEAGYPLPPDYEPVIQVGSYDLVIMTQSCDLAIMDTTTCPDEAYRLKLFTYAS